MILTHKQSRAFMTQALQHMGTKYRVMWHSCQPSHWHPDLYPNILIPVSKTATFGTTSTSPYGDMFICVWRLLVGNSGYVNAYVIKRSPKLQFNSALILMVTFLRQNRDQRSMSWTGPSLVLDRAGSDAFPFRLF